MQLSWNRFSLSWRRTHPLRSASSLRHTVRSGQWRTRLLFSGLAAATRSLMVMGLLASAGSVSPSVALAAGPCTPPVANPIACENTLPGSPDTEWDVSGGGSPNIQGFATDISYNVGATAGFKVQTDATAYGLDIYRMGYYGGTGARKITSVQPSAALPQAQPSCLSDSATGLIDCGNWAVSASWAIPSTAVSGIYFARLVRPDTGDASHVFFVVRNDASQSDILFQTSDTTWQAYNDYGGSNFYGGNAPTGNGRAYKLSYNRPFTTRGGRAPSWVFNAEYPMVRWLEANGYNVNYFSGVDSDRFGSLIKNHKLFLSVGHDEYWSGAQRANVESARDSGVNLAFFSGNEVYWKTRWENAIDGSGNTYRTLVCYKETAANAVIDPADPSTWTGTWRDPRFSPPADGGRPENALIGQIFDVNAARNDALSVPSAYSQMRLWRNTAIAGLAPGATYTFPAGTLGFEWDEDKDNGFRPAGVGDYSSTTVSLTTEYLLDYGSNFGAGTATHSLTLYKAASGARVFGAGTVQWSWGLDASHDGAGGPVDTNMQQATVNLFADMGGIQPATLQPGLVAASASTDAGAPTSTIAAPASGASVQGGTTVNITGTATDAGGGVIAGVEVSVDNGTTWHKAAGREQWSYAWTPGGPPSTATIRSRAVDDSGNVETPAAGRSVSVQPRACPCSAYDSNPATPAVASYVDAQGVELGAKVRFDSDGAISGVKFFKGAGTSGTHLAHLWTSTGSLVASGRFTSETASGWQTATFASPVAVAANTTYVVSYWAPANTGYALSQGALLSSGIDNFPVHILANGTDGANGVFSYGSSAFPVTTNNASNYWVDAVFTTNYVVRPSVVGQSPAPSASGISPTTAVTATFNESVVANSISMALTDSSNATVPSSVSYNASTRVATLQPNAALGQSTTFTVTVSGAVDSNGGTMAGPVIWSFTTIGPAPNIWAPTVVPPTPAYPDSQPVELGVKFRSDLDGYITGVRFYKGTANTGTHIGHLWSTAGQLLGTGTFTNETATGWQQMAFDAPARVSANTTYIASYFAPNGNYALSSNFFASSGVDNYPLHALADKVDGPNGVYKYGPSSFPDQTYSSGNYWVDVAFSTTTSDRTPPRVLSQSPAAGAKQVSPSSTPGVTFSEAINPAGVTFTLQDAKNTNVPGTVSYDDKAWTFKFTPTSSLALATQYTATISGARDLAGNPMAGPVSWSFTTVACPCSGFDAQTVPATADYADPTPVELGVKFRSDVAGFATGVRFYKGTGNTGTHVGHLWSSTGQLLASATFGGETATGWQQANFGGPIQLNANTTYIISYLAPVGNFALNSGFFAQRGVDNFPLHLLADGVDGGNGVFVYGSAGGFPTQTYGAGNYWVDVVFNTSGADTTPPTVSAQTPAPGATGTLLTSTASATFSEPVAPASISFTLRDANNTNVPGSVTYNNSSYTSTFAPTSALVRGMTYTATLSGAKDLAGNPMAAPVSWSFSTLACPCTIWDNKATPATASYPDTSPLEVGVKFTADTNGTITGVRFYKGSGNTGTHKVNLWTTTGQLLATADSANETASGWQTVSFAKPVTITAGTTYVASYFAPNGNFALNANFFNSAVDRSPLHALANGPSGGNGVYAYKATSTYPSQAGNGSNYWVDVVFQ